VKRIYVHCGLHKTGSTSLQTAFKRSADKLREIGVLYPKTGRLDTLGGGHHNIAWQAARDRRFDAGLGTIAQLIQEINNFPGNAVLSSEDFETLLSTARSLQDLRAAFARADAEIVLVIYVRNQISYSESIFVENLGQWIGEEYRRYVETILRTGRLALKDWSFQFGYGQLADNLAATGGAVVVRNFHTLVGGSAITDFADVIGIDPVIFGADAQLRSNERPPTQTLLRLFHRNRTGRPIGELEAKAIKLISDGIGARRLVSSNAAYHALRATFIHGNQKLCRQFGLAETGLDLAVPTHNPAETVLYDQAFSFEFQYAVTQMRHLFASNQPEPASAIAISFVKTLLNHPA
jgi:hypothetical protein